MNSCIRLEPVVPAQTIISPSVDTFVNRLHCRIFLLCFMFHVVSYRGRESFSVGAAMDVGGVRLVCGEDGILAEEENRT